ncbi:MAG: histidine--tRNA ligase [candidate division Zixibacteria bacterium]
MSKKKNKPKKIKPEVLKGFKDYPPSEEIARQKLVAVFREVFESFGFSPLQTPALERVEVLKGSDYGQENLETIFSFVGPEKTDMALRFEMTASLARYVAGNPDLPLPFRRYQIGPVWRVDKPGPGRFREFTQFDIDSVGTSSMLADAEIMAAICKSFEKLGLPNYKVKYSNRKILNGIWKYVGIPDEKAQDVFRVLDKREKQGMEAVKLELGSGRTDKSGDKIQGLNLPEFQIRMIMWFLLLKPTKSTDVLTMAERLLKFAQFSKDMKEVESEFGWTEAISQMKLGEISMQEIEGRQPEAGIREAQEGIEELRLIASYLKNLGVPEEKAEVDLTIVRGLGYYTGPVFETVLEDIPEVGSVFAGGRYDGLVERFLGRKIPATGASAGIDRLLAALMLKGVIKTEPTISEVLVTAMDKERMPDYLQILNEIRGAGIKAEIFLGETRNFTKQVKYADRVGIPVAVILGSDEFENSQVTVKNLVAGRVQAEEVADREEWLKAENIQVTIPRDKMLDYLKKLLGEIKKS